MDWRTLAPVSRAHAGRYTRAMNENNPYAPPKASVEPVEVRVAAPALWNPNAAASWSLLFSPIFGAILHMKNWQALGEAKKAESARAWAMGSLLFFVAVAIVSIALPDSKAVDGFGRAGGIGLLVAWYYANGKAQQGYVLAKFGKRYPKRGWIKPLLLALLALVGYIAAFAAIAVVVEIFTGRA